MRHSIRSFRLVLPLLVLAALAAAPYFGPPRIAVKEVTGTPPTPGAVLDIVATHHTDEAVPDVAGRAEGLKAGQRVSQKVALTATATRGHYGVAKQWEAGTPWVLVFTIRQGDHGDHGTAEALVKVDAAGKVVGITHMSGENARGDRFPRAATKAEVEAALRELQK